MRILTALFTFGLLHASMGQMDGSGSGDDSDMEIPIPSSNINTSTPKQLASTTVVLGGEDDEDTNDVYFVSSGEKECEGSGDCEEPLVTLPTMKPSEKTTTSTTPVPVQPDSKITVSEDIISIEDVVKLGIGIGEDVIQDFVQTSTQSQLPTRSPTKRPTELIYRIQTDPPTTAVKPDPTEEVKTRQYDLTAGNVGGRTVERTEITVPPLIGHPGILAAVIGGGVVALLCAILLVMFIVYRMRKKDEGSYPLDDKPRHAAYTSVPSKEFFA